MTFELRVTIILSDLLYVFQTEKKMLRAEADRDDALLTKSSLDIELVAENQDDINAARMMKYRTVACKSLLRENFNDFI